MSKAMRLIPISLMVLVGVMLIGCQGGDVKGVDAVSSTTAGSAAPSGDTPTDSPGTTGSSTAMPEGGTTGSSMGTPPTATGGSAPSMPAGSSAAAPEAVKSIAIPMYPGATEDPENKDSSVPTDEGTQTVVTRLTSDSFDKVKAFYGDKVKWTEKTEVEGLAIYEFANGKNKEVLGINDRGDKRAIQITKLESK